MTGEEAQIGERRVAAVQQAQLHRLERRDVGDELGAVVLPARARGDEAVLDHPLPERLEDDRNRIGEPELTRDVGDVGVGRRRHDAVDHRRRERDVATDPVRERRVAGLRERDDDRLDHAAVVREVVAADDVHRSAPAARRAASPATSSPGALVAASGAREIADDLRMREVEPARRGIVAVALFGDGQRHHADCRDRPFAR